MLKNLSTYPLPGLVFEEGSNDSIESVDVPGLVHKVDPSKSGRKTVLLETRKDEIRDELNVPDHNPVMTRVSQTCGTWRYTV